MKKIIVILIVIMFAMTCFNIAVSAKYPDRTITNVVVWSAGGGTDACNRVVMAEMQKILGVNVNVVNKTGGVAGSAGMNFAYSKPADGYTLCGLSESCVTAGVQGGFDKRMNVWDYFIIGGSPDVVSVTPDTPFETLEDLIEAGKSDPGGITAAASGAGSIHHLNLLALMDGTGAEFNFIPYTGSAPAQNAAMTGEVNLVVTSVAEQAQLIRGGKLRPLAVLIPDSFELAGENLPSAFDFYPELSEYLPISQAIGFAIKMEAADDVKQVLRDAFAEALETENYKKWATENFYVTSGATGEEATKIFNKLESLFAWTLWDLEAAKVNPEELDIPKP